MRVLSGLLLITCVVLIVFTLLALFKLVAVIALLAALIYGSWLIIKPVFISEDKQGEEE